MKRENLFALVKVVLRVSGDIYDTEINMLIDSAIEDLKRVGVRGELLDQEFPPLVVRAICCFCKAQFGFDNEDAPFFMDSYRQTACDLMNSSANECSGDPNEV